MPIRKGVVGPVVMAGALDLARATYTDALCR